MRHSILVALSAVLLAGCMPAGDPLLPELQGRWAPERGIQVRVAVASGNSNVPVTTPSTKDLCQSEFVTFQRGPLVPGTAGAVFLYREGGRVPMFVVREAKREGDRIILTGHRDMHLALANEEQARIELILRKGAITFDNLFDHRGRSLRYDLFNTGNSLGARRAGVTTVGDVFRMLFDLKSCTA